MKTDHILDQELGFDLDQHTIYLGQTRQKWGRQRSWARKQKKGASQRTRTPTEKLRETTASHEQHSLQALRHSR